MDLLVFANGFALWGDARFRCALGAAGVQKEKCEGDRATPEGVFPFRRVLYRADRLAAPNTRLPMATIAPEDGWCDDPGHRAYNQPVTLPFAASAERLWREDARYDLVLIPGHNDAPATPGKGSAIFVHLTDAAYSPTEGCVALALADLQKILSQAGPGDRLCLSADAL